MQEEATTPTTTAPTTTAPTTTTPTTMAASGSNTNPTAATTPTVESSVRQGNILATAFHPELTSDSRWHRFFLDMDKESQAKAFSALSVSSSRDPPDLPKNKPLDLPIFE